METRKATFLRAARLAATVSDPTRAEIVSRLAAGPRWVKELTVATGMAQSAVSHHLAVLVTAGAASCRRDGARRYYRLTPLGDLLAGTVSSLAAAGEEGLATDGA